MTTALAALLGSFTVRERAGWVSGSAPTARSVSAFRHRPCRRVRRPAAGAVGAHRRACRRELDRRQRRAHARVGAARGLTPVHPDPETRSAFPSASPGFDRRRAKPKEQNIMSMKNGSLFVWYDADDHRHQGRGEILSRRRRLGRRRTPASADHSYTLLSQGAEHGRRADADSRGGAANGVGRAGWAISRRRRRRYAARESGRRQHPARARGHSRASAVSPSSPIPTARLHHLRGFEQQAPRRLQPGTPGHIGWHELHGRRRAKARSRSTPGSSAGPRPRRSTWARWASTRPSPPATRRSAA